MEFKLQLAPGRIEFKSKLKLELQTSSVDARSMEFKLQLAFRRFEFKSKLDPT